MHFLLISMISSWAALDFQTVQWNYRWAPNTRQYTSAQSMQKICTSRQRGLFATCHADVGQHAPDTRESRGFFTRSPYLENIEIEYVAEVAYCNKWTCAQTAPTTISNVAGLQKNSVRPTRDAEETGENNLRPRSYCQFCSS